MGIKRFRLCIIAFGLLLWQELESKKIFFDLGDVLLRQARCQGFFFLGPSLIMRYLFSCGRLPSREHFLTYLKNNYGRDIKSSMPVCFRAWMTGKYHSNTFVDEVITMIEHDQSLKPAEREFFITAANALRPENIKYLIKPDLDGLDIVIDCLQHNDEQGNPNEVYIVSNWDGESYDLIKKHNPALFNLFDDKNILISGKLGLIKPDSDLFEYVIKVYQLEDKLSECIFIDDAQENVESAQAHGFSGIQHFNWYATRAQLRKLGVFGARVLSLKTPTK